MKYIDTSLVVSAFTLESTTERAVEWLALQQRSDLVCSEWLWTEVSSALARKAKAGKISALEHTTTLNRIKLEFAPNIALLPVEQGDFETAASFCDRYNLGLRAADALHLAVAARHRAMLVTFDKSFAAGARALGYDVDLIA